MIVYICLLLFVCGMIYTLEHLNFSRIMLCPSKGDKYKLLKKLEFAIIFLTLAVFSAIRDEIGVDYASYMNHIQNIQLGKPNYMESGFKFLAKVIGRINSNPRLVIIVFAILTSFFYIKAIYEQSSNVLMSIFIFLSWGYYFFTFNTIRNYFALAMCLYSLKFLKEKKYTIFLILILLASTIHKSALVCIPIYLLANYDFTLNQLRFMILCPVIAFMMKTPVKKFLLYIYPGYFGSVYDTGQISYLNIIKALAVVILGIMFYNRLKNNKLCKIYFHLNIFALVYYIGFYWVPEISRIGFYMNATSIMFIPNVIRELKLKKNQKILNISIYIFSFVLFILLMQTFYSPSTKLLPYQTWIL